MDPQPEDGLDDLFGVPFSKQCEEDPKAGTSDSSCECDHVVLLQSSIP